MSSYEKAVNWIAFNDNDGSPEALKPKYLVDQVTIVMVADLFGRTELAVAADVVRVRKAYIAEREAEEKA